MLSRRPTVTTLLDTVRLLFSVSRPATLGVVFTSLFEAVFYPGLLLLVGSLLRTVIGGHNPRGSITIIVILFGLVAAQGAVTVLNESLTAILRARVTLQLTIRLMEKLSTVPYRLFEDNEFQGSYGLMIREASHRTGTLVEVFVSTLIGLVSFLGIAVTLFVLAPVLMPLFAVALLLGLVEVAFRTRTVDLQTAAAPELMRMQFLSQMQVDSRWQRDLRVYNSQVLEQEYAALGFSYVERLRRLVHRYAYPRVAAGVGSALAIAGSVWWVIHLVIAGALSHAGAAVLLPGVYIGLTQARMLSGAAGALVESLVYANLLSSFLSADFGAMLASALPGMTEDPQAIILENVSFSYPESARSALADVSFAVEPGVTAIVGPNGSGKSTLIKLLARLLEPSGGSIIFPEALAHAHTSSTRAVLFQEPAHLSLTVRQNVTMRFADDCSDTAVWHALEQAGLSRAVKQLPGQLEAVLGAGFGGVADLSGGQWQRLALARLLFHDAPLILLDEPVASLDADGEREIFSVLRDLALSRHIVFTTHRYDTLMPADRVLMLVDGRLTEAGTHAALLRKHAEYWALVDSARKLHRSP